MSIYYIWIFKAFINIYVSLYKYNCPLFVHASYSATYLFFKCISNVEQ